MWMAVLEPSENGSSAELCENSQMRRLHFLLSCFPLKTKILKVVITSVLEAAFPGRGYYELNSPSGLTAEQGLGGVF